MVGVASPFLGAKSSAGKRVLCLSISPFAEDIVLIPQPGDQRLSEVKHCLISCFTKRKRGGHSSL